MIMIEVDEAYALDMLCIFQLKASRSPVDLKNFTLFLSKIAEQVGLDVVDNILSSEQYTQLYDVNKHVFDLIEKINEGEIIDARVVHEANMGRFYAKKELQATFFNHPLSEQKTVK
jgi:hypothetical protein